MKEKEIHECEKLNHRDMEIFKDGKEWILEVVSTFSSVAVVVEYCPFCGEKLDE